MLFLLIIPIWYPYLVAFAAPKFIPIIIICCAGMIYVIHGITKHKTSKSWKFVRISIVAYMAIVIIGQLLAPIVHHSHKAWIHWLVKTSAGIKRGMTREQVKESILSSAYIVRAIEGEPTKQGYHIKPNGLAQLIPVDWGLYGISVEYDDSGKVTEVNGWRD